MPANVGFATLSVIPSLKGVEGAISSQLGGPLAAASSKAGAQSATAVGGGFTSKIGGALKGATLPLIGIGVAAIASAKGVEDAQNTILRTTGASGKAADGLLASFKNVAKGSAASLGTVAEVLAEVSQRTGLVGKPLEGLTSQIVTFNRITKDAPIGVKDLTQTLAGFKIPAAQSSAVLDKLFTISQKTGVPLADLNSTLGASGAILRQFNLPIEQAASIMAKLDKAGVPASAAMGGLKKAFTTFAKAGLDPKQSLVNVLGEIDKLIKAGDKAGAQQLGVKIFGARGVGLVDAAIAGKLSIADLTKTVPNLGKGIAATAASTSTMSGKLGVLKNNAQLALANLGGPLLDAATTGLKTLVPIVQGLASGFSSLPGPLKTVAVGLIAIGATAGPISKIVGGIGKIGGSAKKAGKALFGSTAEAKGFFRAGGGAGKLASGISTAGKAVLGFAKNVAVGTFNLIKNTAAFVAQKVAAFAAAAAQKAMAAAQWLLNAAMSANPIGLIVVGIAALAAGFVLAYQHITPFRNAVDALGRAFLAAFNWVKDNWPKVLGILTAPIAAAVAVLTGEWHAITAGVGAVFGFIQTKWPLLLGILTGPIGLAVLVISRNFNTIKAVVGTVFGAVKNAFDRVVGFVTGIPGRITGAFGDASKLLYDIGSQIIGGLIDGIKGALGPLGDVLGSVGGFITDHKGPPSKDKKLLTPIGGLIMGGLVDGIKGGMPRLEKQLGLISSTVAKTPLKLGKVQEDDPRWNWKTMGNHRRGPTHADLVAGANFGAGVTSGKVSPIGLLLSGATVSLVRAVEKAQAEQKRHPVVRTPHVQSTVSAASLASARPAAASIIQNFYGYTDNDVKRLAREGANQALRANHIPVVRGAPGNR